MSWESSGSVQVGWQGGGGNGWLAGLGRAIGLVIRRFGATGSYIIPGDRVAARIADLRLGKPLSGFPTPSAQPAAAVPSPR
jgi:hypothetical protein